MTEGRLVGGRYRLVRALGAGGFGSVWLAHDETLRVDVAVKEVRLPPTGTAAEHAELLERAQREARHAARLRDHPHVVGVHDVVLDGGAPWTVMQLIVGRSLHERIAEGGPLPVPEAARVASAVLAALDAAHRAGIVHRDVKPANILLAGDGRVLLADFGIAVQQEQTALTASGMFVGSVDYIAPERAQGGPADPAGDLFSLGATLYQAVEGRLPFRRDTPVGTLTAVLFEPPAPCVLAGPLAPLIDGLLAKDPAARLTGARAAAMLAPHLGAHPPAAAAAPTAAATVPNALPPAAPRAARRSVASVLPPLLVLAALGAALLLNAFSFHPDSQLPPSGAVLVKLAHTPLFEALSLNSDSSAVGLSWLWLLPTAIALLATAWYSPRVPAAVRTAGFLLTLVLPVRLGVADLWDAGPHLERLVHALPPEVASHLDAGHGPGWWLLHVAAFAAPVVLLAGRLLHRERH
ncbi:serine/threonine-protein kinase [Kitasatospora sp. NPDC048407]|uniref:serine/threonine-protein kinase n=1 Tax=Kitasatospora sp. NPDC048407 TaxID=3364051 RepID=UPI0037210C24